ncbi:MAG: hypothetical protein D6766_11805 [Verrucomicrobia bacterium]|nr:MAG: hypothetical protein D6766_11805 [Verrucomicrobiota bacterium]
MRTLLCLTVSMAALGAGLVAGGAGPANDDARLAWWREARFGLFIHWGPVALKGTEIGWSRGAQVPVAEYDQLYRRFNPTNFDATAWARLAREAGCRYLILTAKHHDGFALWDSAVSDYDIAATPFRRDVVKELGEACRREGVVFGTYYSILDWWHPDYPTGSPGGRTRKPNPNMARYVQYLHAQVTELIRDHGPLGVMWFDGEWEAPWTEEMGRELYALCRRLQPSIIVNNRVAKARRGMEGASAADRFAGDYDTPEQRVGRYQDDRPWESCITLCRQWAWKPNDRMKSLEQCLRTLALCAGGDGNLLLNVGPMPDGRIEPRQAARLREIGAWLRTHGEAVYGTRGGPWKPGPWGASTRRDRRVYLHLFQPDQPVRLPRLPRRIVSARTLPGKPVTLRQEDDSLRIEVPAGARETPITVVVLELDGSAMDLPAVETGPPNLARGCAAKASNVFQGMVTTYGPAKAVDGRENTRWATDAGTRQAWLELDLGQPRTIGAVTIQEAYPGRVQRFRIERETAGGWETILEGGRLGERFHRSFDPVKARRVRLSIQDATEGPTIAEFALHPPGH